MLTLEQISAVNDGFHRGDLNAALVPLEETVDLRANELPRLDKKAMAALKEGLAKRDDAATWAQAIFHPNVSLRRFARKIFMGLGDDAAPVFDPLRARLERFWGEEEPLPESNKSREAALRREQNEQVESALEILLRANPEKFLEFYAQLADGEADEGDATDELAKWHERNRAAWQATQDETTRLLKAEWGEKFADYSERWKLPSRVLRELDEKARVKPKIAAMWADLGDNVGQFIAPAWNPAGLLMGTWNGYLNAEKPTGPIERVNERLRPTIWHWLRAAFDSGCALDERQKFARHFASAGVGYQIGGWVGRQRLLQEVPALLLGAKGALLPALQSLSEKQADQTRRHRAQGEEVIAELWLSVANGIGYGLVRPYGIKAGEWKAMPAIEPQTLRALAQELPANKYGPSHALLRAAGLIEQEHAARAKKVEPVAASPQSVEAKTAPHRTDREILSEMLGHHASDRLYPTLHSVQAKIASLKAESAQMDTEERIGRLLTPLAYGSSIKNINRLVSWKVWLGNLNEAAQAQLQTEVWPRVEPQLWARMEEQLGAHRRLETEAIEPDIAQKLTEREAKEWRTRVRREKRADIAKDVMDIANLLIHVDGLPARLRAIELADRPGCREIRDQLERGLFYQLEVFPGNMRGAVVAEEWQDWKLGAEWDEILERAEARLEAANDPWTRNVLTRELAIGYYRRGDFARFESYLGESETFPHAIAKAAVAFDDFEAWRVLLNSMDELGAEALGEFWRHQQNDEARRARATTEIVRIVATTSSDKIARELLKWLAPLESDDYASCVPQAENALESPIVSIKKWAMSVLAKSAEFDRERAAQTASESLWSENAALAKDATKFLSVLATQDENVAELAWDALNDATSLENIGLCEAVYRALVKVKSKRKTLELSEAAREKLEALEKAQSERFGKFAAKL